MLHRRGSRAAVVTVVPASAARLRRTSRYRSRFVVVLAGLALAGLALAGCGAQAAAPVPRPAEPATAPSLAVPPAGKTVDLPAESAPEGIVVDPDTGLVVVALRRPDRLALLDPATLAVRDVRPIGGQARHLQLAGPGGPVLLSGEDTNNLLEIALPSGRVRSSTPVGLHPHDAANVGGDLWVADEFSSGVSVVRDGKVIEVLRGPVQPGGVATVAGRVGVVDVRGARLYLYDATTFRSLGSVAAGAGPTHAVAVGSGRMLVADTRGGAALLVDVVARRIVSRLAMPGSPYGIWGDPATGEAWVTLVGRNEVVRLSTAGGTVRELGRFPTVQQPNTVAVDPGTSCAYVTGKSASVVQRLCPTN